MNELFLLLNCWWNFLQLGLLWFRQPASKKSYLTHDFSIFQVFLEMRPLLLGWVSPLSERNKVRGKISPRLNISLTRDRGELNPGVKLTPGWNHTCNVPLRYKYYGITSIAFGTGTQSVRCVDFPSSAYFTLAEK